MTDKQFVYFFGEGTKDMKKLLGGKGANLSEMAKIGLPVPPGFVISTQACMDYLKEKKLPQGTWEEMEKAMKELEQETGKKFGDSNNPLLVSVRSGAAAS